MNKQRFLAPGNALLVAGCSVVLSLAIGTVAARGSTLRAPTHERATSCLVTTEAGSGAPTLVAVGASFTAGVGAATPADNWAVRLAELLGWRAVTIGVPGAGYTHPGLDALGPLAHEVNLSGLASLHPQLVLVQAGHDDWRASRLAERAAVARLVAHLEKVAPAATLAFLTVFARPGASERSMALDERLDDTIVSAIRATDPRAVVIDPLRARWQFPRAAGGLHPTTAGHLLIARRVATALFANGTLMPPRPGPAPTTVACKFLQPALASGPPGSFRLRM